MSYDRDDRYDTYEYYRQKDDFYREQDRQYENFRDDLEWHRQQAERRSELGKAALQQGNVPWVLHWMGGTDQAIDLLTNQGSTPFTSSKSAKSELSNLMEKAVVSFKNKSFAKAYEQFSQLTKRWQDFGTAYAYRAACSYALGKYQASVSDLDRAIRLAPRRAALYLNRGRAYDRLNEMARAESDYNRAISIDSDLIPAHYRRGLLRMRSRRYDDAITDFSRVIRAKPSYLSYVYLNRGRCRYYKDQLSTASDDFSKVLAIEPENFQALMGRARCSWAKKQWSKAIENCDHALKLKPDNADAYRLRGDCRASLKEYPLAHQDFSKSIHLAPEDYLTLYARGRLYLDLGKLSEAIADIRKCGSINTRWGTPRLVLGDIYVARGDYKNAINSYHQAEELFNVAGNAKMRGVARKACENIFAATPR